MTHDPRYITVKNWRAQQAVQAHLKQLEARIKTLETKTQNEQFNLFPGVDLGSSQILLHVGTGWAHVENFDEVGALERAFKIWSRIHCH
jgi:electron transfer flavoprotein alpha subunit